MDIMDIIDKEIEISLTKRGLPALWEEGGGYTNTGSATIIADHNGKPKKALYIRKKGMLANSNHALIVIKVGDYVIKTSHHNKDFEILIYSISKINKEKQIAELIFINYFGENEWEYEFSSTEQKLSEAIEASMEKATCYHCREPHFIDIETESQ